MPKEEWGTKRLCPETGKRFYDLNRDPIVSPYTGEVVSFDADGTVREVVEAKPEKPAASDDAELIEAADEVLAAGGAKADLDDELLEDDDDDRTVPLEEIADVPAEDGGDD